MRNRFHVFDANGLDEVATILEGYDLASLVEPDFNAEDADMPHAVFVLKTAMLRIHLDEAR